MSKYGSCNRAGTYILGSAFAWHGGIHLETDEDLVAIADGRLIVYRVAEKYTEEEIEGVGKTRYSNCFALLKHEFSADGIKFTYYSLYNHLWPASEMKNKFVSELFQKCTWKVKGDNEDGVFGIMGYECGILSFFQPGLGKKKLVPFDETLEVLNEVEIETGGKPPRVSATEVYYKVQQLESEGLFRFNQYLLVKKNDVEDVGDVANTSNTFEDKPQKNIL
ncbi:MAG TPA: hypothetical protein DEG09_12305 [Marinilabiliaceae bacterium]|nr:hypothetical protein [Marinilabiliaceae bacterium]